jgi:hypothetical protein
MFFRGSRYEQIKESIYRAEDGREIRHKRLRFVPNKVGVAALRVIEGDRADLLAFRALGDAELFWRLADVNRRRRPVDLARAPGELVAVPGPATAVGSGRGSGG